jgi:hypothetical protein
MAPGRLYHRFPHLEFYKHCNRHAHDFTRGVFQSNSYTSPTPTLKAVCNKLFVELTIRSENGGQYRRCLRLVASFVYQNVLIPLL